MGVIVAFEMKEKEWSECQFHHNHKSNSKIKSAWKAHLESELSQNY